MDQSYFRFLFRLVRKSKQSGLSKSDKVWLKGMQPLSHTQALINYRDFSNSILSLSMVTGLDVVVSTTLNMGGTD